MEHTGRKAKEEVSPLHSEELEQEDQLRGQSQGGGRPSAFGGVVRRSRGAQEKQYVEGKAEQDLGEQILRTKVWFLNVDLHLARFHTTEHKEAKAEEEVGIRPSEVDLVDKELRRRAEANAKKDFGQEGLSEKKKPKRNKGKAKKVVGLEESYEEAKPKGKNVYCRTCKWQGQEKRRPVGVVGGEAERKMYVLPNREYLIVGSM
ncbi:hypothetical protein BC938DRAFT_484184 [Jimgerdemannia flammicorona]|uniref:Uncharacterized protein n=1 Tax=Jimgerdemannia flammicorona TaxID=994334 RepID=A0A433R053_9FUNG|nr:hypothetical protein BC938DRAFT_484184 [Jimgerdemannia flammicorona]